MLYQKLNQVEHVGNTDTVNRSQRRLLQQVIANNGHDFTFLAEHSVKQYREPAAIAQLVQLRGNRTTCERQQPLRQLLQR